MPQKISLFIITKNEEVNIGPCILSAKELVDEVVVVDSFSQDRTAQIAKELGAKVYQRSFVGFADQKNFALQQTTFPWALNLDADEQLSPQLCQQIKNVLPGTSYAGFTIPRANYFLGKPMKHSGLDKEYHLRLVRKDAARYEGELVHEKLRVDGPVGRINTPFWHNSYSNIESYFNKFNHYTTLAARQMQQKGRKFSLLFVLITIPFEFLKRYVLKCGFLDGIRGFLWASFSAFYVFVKYMKLWDITRKDSL